MEPEQKQYQFVNSRTGNVIGYLSVDTAWTNQQLNRELENKRSELAVANHLRIDSIYWQLPA